MGYQPPIRRASSHMVGTVISAPINPTMQMSLIATGFGGTGGAASECSKLLALPLDAHGDAHAAADAERGEALFRVALLHLVQQRDEHACAAGADGMADGDGAAIDVHLGRVPAHVLVHRAGLC